MFEKRARGLWRAFSVSADKDRRERGERYKTRKPMTVGKVHDLLFEAFMSVQKGSQGGDLECNRCRCGIVVESTRAGWSDDSSGIPDPSPDCVRFNRTDPRRADLYTHPHQCLLTNVVDEALPKEPGLQPSLDSSSGKTVKFVLRIIKGRGFQNLSLLIVLIIIN
jgi:hypothetical protein